MPVTPPPSYEDIPLPSYEEAIANNPGPSQIVPAPPAYTPRALPPVASTGAAYTPQALPPTASTDALPHSLPLPKITSPLRRVQPAAQQIATSTSNNDARTPTVVQPTNCPRKSYNECMKRTLLVYIVQFSIMAVPSFMAVTVYSAKQFFGTHQARTGALVLIGVALVPCFFLIGRLTKVRTDEDRRKWAIFSCVFWTLSFGLLATFIAGVFVGLGVGFGLVGCVLLYVTMIIFHTSQTEKNTEKNTMTVALILAILLSVLTLLSGLFLSNQVSAGASAAPLIVMLLGYTLYISAMRNYDDNRQIAKVDCFVPAKAETELFLFFIIFIINFKHFNQVRGRGS